MLFISDDFCECYRATRRCCDVLRVSYVEMCRLHRLSRIAWHGPLSVYDVMDDDESLHHRVVKMTVLLLLKRTVALATSGECELSTVPNTATTYDMNAISNVRLYIDG